MRLAGQICARILAGFSKKRPKRELCFSLFPQNVKRIHTFVERFFLSDRILWAKLVGKYGKLLATLSSTVYVPATSFKKRKCHGFLQIKGETF
jgi:hypothetical protein